MQNTKTNEEFFLKVILHGHFDPWRWDHYVNSKWWYTIIKGRHISEEWKS